MAPERDDRPGELEITPAGEEWEVWSPAGEAESFALVDLVNRVLDKGVVLTGDITISVAGVDLVYLGLNAVLSSVSTARRTLGRRVGREAGAEDASGGG